MLRLLTLYTIAWSDPTLLSRFPPHVSEGAKDIISQLLMKDPAKRITLDKVTGLGLN